MGRALQWRYPRVLFARAPRPDPRGGRLPYTWRKFLAPMRREETGEPLRRQTRHRRVGQWDDPAPCSFLRARRRLTLFEGTTAAGRDHAVGVDWWGHVWDNDPARQPPPYPGPEATWREVAYAVHALLPVVTEVWWAVLPEPGRSTPRRCGPTPSAAPGRGRSKTACTRSSGIPSASRATGSEVAPSVRRRLPCRAPVAERRCPRRRPLRRPARPPLDGDRARLPYLGAARLGPTVNLQACLAAPLTSLPAPCDQRRAVLCGGWGLPPSPLAGRGPLFASRPR